MRRLGAHEQSEAPKQQPCSAAVSSNGHATWCRLHNGDARDLLRIIPQDSADLILTSPPYADLKDYGYKGQIGFGQTFDAYLQDMRGVLEACFEAAKPTATLWLISDVFKKNGEMIDLPAELARCASDAGWKLQDVVIWHKTKTLPWSHRGRLRKIFEYVHVFAKSKNYKYFPERIRETEGLQEWWAKYPERYNPFGKTPHNIWHFPIPTQGSWGNGVLRHFNPFPPALVERIVELTTDPGDVVLDPFAGTGTVLAQAECMGRLAAGVEINPYFTDQLFFKVRAEIERVWNGQLQRRMERQRKAAQFDSLILRMRKVKLGKQVLKILSRYTETEDYPCLIAGIILDRQAGTSGQLGRHKLGAVDLLLVAESPVEASAAATKALALSSRPPLSKYGVQVNIRGVTSQEFIEEELQRLRSVLPWYVYPAGTMQAHSGSVQFPDILNFCKDTEVHPWKKGGVPPVFSDIRVEQEEIQQFLG
ncbi:MAG: site-specific DNA-methyltransferase [Chloroflexi bacterium]|nr:site-specific DNA-methyltransferase [Chloroflexota bacterium]